MCFMATSSLVSLWRISFATPKLPDPMSRTTSYFSILPYFPSSAKLERLPLYQQQPQSSPDSGESWFILAAVCPLPYRSND
ncbi:hypothetical protein B296_00059124 [Ensete ventricosum]|uniref:Secreted protein n=1 Tax=Ensete ventricosum TaxID=4639 RepID=A0A426X515_ENSVE|nr:hypothetical protein B296_00059124 [Ensete ventricosum]